jgi:serine kinase of HPr protein (carbohydrate metabolism regulator)
MQVIDLVNELNLNVFSGKNGLDKEVKTGYVSDLLSDVMGNSEAGSVWITLQTHKNTMAIASLRDLAAIILVNSQEPEEDTAEQSEEEGIPILGTTLATFEISGQLYNLLKR